MERKNCNSSACVDVKICQAKEVRTQAEKDYLSYIETHIDPWLQ